MTLAAVAGAPVERRTLAVAVAVADALAVAASIGVMMVDGFASARAVLAALAAPAGASGCRTIAAVATFADSAAVATASVDAATMPCVGALL